MKKIKSRLQLTTSTVRVLRDAELSAVQGGLAAPGGPKSSLDPTACVVADGYLLLDGAQKR